VRFGLMDINHCGLHQDPGEVYANFIDICVTGEQLGYWSMWTTEHHFGSDAGYRPYGVSEDEYPHIDYDLSPDPLTLLTWAAAKTSRLRVGTAVAILHWDHPVRTAERAAMLDVLSGGRLELGVGRGAGFREADVFQVLADPAANNRRYHEAIAVIRGLWSGEPFAFDGEFFQLPELILRPRPKQQPAPIWVGSASLESAAWAAQEHLPYATITWPLTEIEMYRQKRALFLEAAEASGFDVSGVYNPHVLFLYCGESDEEAAETMFPYLMQYQYIIEHHYEFGRPHGANQGVLAAQDDMWKNLEPLARFPIDNHIVGSAETCAERVDFFQRELGVNYILCNVGWGQVPHEKTVASMRRFAEQVMPRFAAEPALAPSAA
jgi:alkanesulfonate monooxygenase SsuD/methylene tetrahydromethanopterin reductase-like flavin-dependent oxidoreductase (luciferase family)